MNVTASIGISPQEPLVIDAAMKEAAESGYTFSRQDAWESSATLETEPEGLVFGSHVLNKSRWYAVRDTSAIRLIRLSQPSEGALNVSQTVWSSAPLDADYGLYPKNEAVDVGKVKYRFWNNGPHGASSIRRDLVSPTWDEISRNYHSATSTLLDGLMGFQDRSDGGKLILWSGNPGLGKTYAIRALAQSWREWCDPHYIIDPEAFLGNSDYMMKVMMDDSPSWDELNNEYEGGKHKLIILEDAGELVTIDARVHVGQALSRLLNITEGMIGQGLKIFIILTTNEELGKLHPAIIRSGRCMSNIKFKELTAEESNSWIGGERFTKAQSLADLYMVANETIATQAR